MTGNSDVTRLGKGCRIRPESLVSLATPSLVDAHVVERYVGNTDLPGYHEPFRRARTPDQMRRSSGSRGDRGTRNYCAKPTRRNKSWNRGSLRSGSKPGSTL